MKDKCIIYGKQNMTYNNEVLRGLYFVQGIRRVKLHRGKWYDLQYSQAQRAVYASVSREQ